MARTITFQRSLFRNLAGVIVLLGVLFVATSFFFSERAKERLATGLTSRAVADTRFMITRFLDPVSNQVELSARYFTAAGVNLDDPLELDRYFLPILSTFDQMSGASVARSDGRSYTLKRTEFGWERRTSNPDTNPGRAFLSRWVDDRAEALESQRDLSYDARTRPWFTGAMQKRSAAKDPRLLEETLHWTLPYRFFEPSGEYGVTASLAFEAPGGQIHVTSFDVLLRDVSTFTMDLRLKESGSVAVLFQDPEKDEMLLAGLPAGIASTREEALDKYLLASPAVVGGALEDYAAAVMADEPSQRERPRQFESGGRVWWGAAAAAGTTNEVWSLAMVPEDELLDDFRRVRLIPIVATLLMVVLALWRSSVLASLYARPVESLVSQSERMAGLNFEKMGTSTTRIQELRMLSEAQEQMRLSFAAISARREDLPIARSLRARANLDQAAPPGYELGLLDQPTESVGGSVFDAVDYARSGAQLGLLLAVVPGEGVPAAAEGGRLQSVFETGVRLGASLAVTVEQIRQHFAASSELAPQLAVCVADLNGTAHTLSVLSQEACPVAHVVAESGELRWVEAAGSDEPVRIELGPGDTVLLLTQSVLHALSLERECFGPERLEQVVQEHAREDAATLANRIGATLDRFTGNTPPDRDRMLLVVRRSAA